MITGLRPPPPETMRSAGAKGLTAAAMVAEVRAVAVAIRLGSDIPGRLFMRATNSAPYCSRPALLGGLRR